VEVGDGAMEGSEEAGWKKGEDYGRSFRPLYFIDDFFGILDVQMKLRVFWMCRGIFLVFWMCR
jgi:hypothetical protein